MKKKRMWNWVSEDNVKRAHSSNVLSIKLDVFINFLRLGDEVIGSFGAFPMF